MEIEHKELCYGRKTLSVDVNVNENTASVRFGTREPRWLFRRKLRETTIIFQQAESILQSMAQRLDQPIHLVFDTANYNLKHWAQTRADQLGFMTDTDNPQDYRVTITKTYYPKNDALI